MITEKGKYRASNFELLRIIAMLFIVFHHFGVHGYCQYASNKLLIPINNVFAGIIIPLGKLGVILFVFITSYFLVDSNIKIKSFLNIYFLTLIYSISIFIFCILNGIYISKGDILKSIMPITHSTYWFITTYLILYILIPFINNLLKFIENKNYESILLVILTLIYLFVHTNITSFIYLYILGGYIKKEVFPLNKLKINHCIYGLLSLFVFIIIYSVIMVSDCTNPEQIYNIMHKLSTIHSPFILMNALFIFYIFKNIRINTNKFINSIAISVFPIYLIHENFLIRPILWKNVMIILNTMYPIITILLIIIMVMWIFSICILIDKLLKYLYKPVIKRTINIIISLFTLF